MRRIFGLVIVLIVPAVFGSAQNSKQSVEEKAQKGPCDTAITQLDLNQCYGEQFRNADAHLNKIYGSLLKRLQSEKSESAIQKLQAAEKVWIRYRDLHCEAARFEFEGGSMNPMVWAQCMAMTTNHRIEEIKAAYETGERKLE
jgi:uncharacterized protein YecT (DUF1311 family)